MRATPPPKIRVSGVAPSENEQAPVGTGRTPTVTSSSDSHVPSSTPAALGARPDLAMRVLAAAVLLSLVLHALLLTLGLHLISYDAHIHTFFASHYLRSPLDLWEPRFYAGFSVASYPPLVHQTMALAAVVAGLDAAFPAVLLLTAAALPVALYAWGRAWVGREAAAFGALAGAILPSVGLAAFAFGQLAQLAGMTVALFTLAALAQYLRHGGAARLALTVALAGTTAAAHHLNVMLFLPIAGSAVAVGALLAGDVPRTTALRRAVVAALLSGGAAALTVLPFGLWTLAYEQQAPIVHASREQVLDDPEAREWFLYPMYGIWPVVLLANLPDLTSRRRVVLAALVGVLAVMGLGATTPLPRLVYGAWTDWLTFDRFAIWAGMAAAPLIGQTLAVLAMPGPRGRERGRPVRPALAVGDGGMRAHTTGPLASAPVGASSMRLTGKRRAGEMPALPAWAAGWMRRMAGMHVRWAVLGITLALGVLAFLWAGTLHITHPTQPPLMDPRHVAAFLADDDNVRWRYLTLGFGDQLARVAAMTDAESVDGNYHTARWLPELRASGIGALDGSLWWDREARTLRAVLGRDLGDRLHLRWVLVYNTWEYDSILTDEGLTYVGELENGVVVWERPDVPPLPGGEMTEHAGRCCDPAAVWWVAGPWTAAGTAIAYAGYLYRRRPKAA